MAINPLDPSSALNTLIDGRQTAPRANAGGASTSFAEKLSVAEGKAQPLSREMAESTAEVLRLEMMKSAMGMTDLFQSPNTANSPTVNAILAAFRQNSQDSATDTTPPSSAIPSGVAPVHTPQAGSYDGIVQQAARRYGVDEGLIKAVIKVESNYNPKAVSSAGAQGLMQLMPATARGLGVTNAFDPEQNIMAGTRFLKDMLNRYHGNLEAALAAYNWGPGNVDRKGMSVPGETRAYIARVKGYYREMQA